MNGDPIVYAEDTNCNWNILMDRSDVEIIEREELYNGFFKMRRYSLKHRTFSGEWSSVLSREVFERGGVAAVIPFDPIRMKSFSSNNFARVQWPPAIPIHGRWR